MKRSWADKWLVAQVYILLGITRLAINTLPFPRLENFLGQRMEETEINVARTDLRQARRIAWAIHAVSAYTPWESNCFPQGLTAKILLRRRGIPSTLYMGARFKHDEESTLGGHIWLRCGPLYVTGGNGSRDFGAIASFAD